MDTFDCIVGRRSIRSFTREEIPKGCIRKILEAARWAPSANNRQPWQFIIIRDPGTLSQIASHARYGRFISDAAAAVAVVTDPSTKWHQIDGSTAVQNMALEAWDLGIGTCWIGSLERDQVKDILNIPGDLHLLTVLPFGYPASAGSSSRRKLDSMIHEEKW